MKRIPSFILALLCAAAITTPYAWGQTATSHPDGPSDTVANGVPTGTTTTGSTPPSPTLVAAPNSPAAASSGSPVTSPTGAYRGTGSSPQNQATGDAKPAGGPSNP